MDEFVLGFYELLLRDAEPEVRSEAVNKIPEVAKYANPELIIGSILPILNEQMSTDQS